MKKSKFYQMNSISIGNKTIIPIASLKVAVYKKTFIDIDYEVSAFKIIENNKIYFKNINLDEEDYSYVVKNFNVDLNS